MKPLGNDCNGRLAEYLPKSDYRIKSAESGIIRIDNTRINFGTDKVLSHFLRFVVILSAIVSAYDDVFYFPALNKRTAASILYW